MSENKDIIDKIVDLCCEKNFTEQRTIVIGYHLGCKQSVAKNGSSRAAYLSFYEQMKDKGIDNPDDALRLAISISGLEHIYE